MKNIIDMEKTLMMKEQRVAYWEANRIIPSLTELVIEKNEAII